MFLLLLCECCRGGKALLQIRGDIVDMLGADGQTQRAHAALQSGKALFQHVLGGVSEPAVDISGVCKIEAGRRG